MKKRNKNDIAVSFLKSINIFWKGSYILLKMKNKKRGLVPRPTPNPKAHEKKEP